MLNYEVVTRDRPYADGAPASTFYHVAPEHGARTICGVSCSVMDYWRVVYGAHPEDVDAIERCQCCYRVLDTRTRQARFAQDRYRMFA